MWKIYNYGNLSGLFAKEMNVTKKQIIAINLEDYDFTI